MRPRATTALLAPTTALVLAAVAGCSSAPPEKKPETPAQRRTRLEREVVASGGRDPWLYLEMGELDELEGDLARAVEDYGAAVSLLPPRRYTRPAVSLGRVHLKLRRFQAARNVFEEVVATVASDPRFYRENPDYKEAALGLREVFQNQPDPKAAERVRQRFLDDFGGAPADWPAPP